jgi:tetratricopeptide (TPR) repeat protein
MGFSIAMGRFCLEPILTCLSFFLISAGSLFAQQLGSIIGEAHVARGDFPGRTLVELQLHGAPIASQYTDEQGKFAFTSIANNFYRIVVRDDRFYPVDQQVMLDVSITAIAMVQINLIPREQTRKRDLPAQKGSNPFIVDTEGYRYKAPKKARKEFDRGLESDRDGKREDAIHHYETAVKMAPDFYQAHNNLGSDYLSKSDFAGARREFEEAVRLNQGDAAAYFNLSNVCMLMGDLPNAQQFLGEGMRRQPDSALGHFLLGSLDMRTGKLQEAEAALGQAIRLSPVMAQARLQLVNLLLQQGRKTDAAAQLHEFVSAFPDNPFSAQAKQLLQRLESRAKSPAIPN